MANGCPRAWRTLVTSLAILLAAGQASVGQPFGVTEGTPVEQLTVTKQLDPFLFDILPKTPHSDFTSYGVLVVPGYGVCRISATSEPFHNDAYGRKARDVFERLSAQLADKYGPSKFFNFLLAGSIWHEPSEWAISKSKNQREYLRSFLKQYKSTLPPYLDSIVIEIDAADSENTFIRMQFDYSNVHNCLIKMHKLEAEAL